jgi:hypothetical protein
LARLPASLRSPADRFFFAAACGLASFPTKEPS